MAARSQVFREQVLSRFKDPFTIETFGELLAHAKRLSAQKKVKVYLVGGYLRDYLLGRPCRDFDFAVSHKAIDFGRAFARRIKGAFVLLDEEADCCRIVKKMGQDAATFDFAGFRARSLRGDLARRDFTINTLSLNISAIGQDKPLGDVMRDPLKGQKDILSGKIRAVSAKAFAEDPLRLLRAFSLQAILGFAIETQTRARVKKERHLLRLTARERIREELFKILASPRCYETFRQMDRIGLLEEVMPQVSVMYKVSQGGYHHLDVWRHSLEALRQLEMLLKSEMKNPDIAEHLNENLGSGHTRLAVLKLGTLLHDIGKPAAKSEGKGRSIFHGHEHIGRSIARKTALMLKISTRERRVLEDLVRFHLRPGYLSNFRRPSDRAVFRFLRDTGEEAAAVLLLSLADQRATRGPMTSQADQRHHEKVVRLVLGRYFEKKKEKPFQRLINGHDLIKELGLTPSPLFAKLLKEVEEQQVLGKVTSRREAVALASRIAGKQS